VPPAYALTKTELTPTQVSGATRYGKEINLLSPPAKFITDEPTIVSSPQLDTADTVTVYLPLPDEQLVIRLKIPTVVPGDAVAVLNTGVATTAHPVEPPPPPPPLPPLPRCPNSGIATSATNAKTNTHLVTHFFIYNPQLK
jgi:hypothetical protein